MPEFNGIYSAIVQDLGDLSSAGRARLLVPSVLGDAPSTWAEPVLGAASTAGAKVGDRAWVLFENGDRNRPTWLSTSVTANMDPWAGVSAWNSTLTYSPGPPADVVTFNGETFVAVGVSTNVDPTTDVTKWLKVAAKGSAPADSTIVIANSGFEQYDPATGKALDWTEFWGPGTTSTTTVGANVHGGGRALVNTLPAASDYKHNQSTIFPVTKGDLVRIAVWAKKTSAGAANIQIGLMTNDATNNVDFFAAGLDQQGSGVITLTTTYAKYEAVFVARTTGHVRARANFTTTSTPGSEVVYLDDVTVQVNTPVTPILDKRIILSKRAEHLLQGGGVRNVIQAAGSITYVTWSQRLIAMGLGKFSPEVPLGYFEVAYPSVGTVIPVYAKTGITTATTVTSGIPLHQWDALYYEPGYGGGSQGFRIVNYSGSDFVVPEHWLFIASQNFDTGALQGSIRWYDGMVDSGWVEPALNAGTNYGGAEANFGWRRTNNVMYFKGTLGVAAGTAFHFIAAGNRPVALQGTALQQTIGSNLGPINLLIRHSDGAMYFPASAPTYTFITEVTPYVVCN